MSTKEENYEVSIEKYAEKHFIKVFKKKYRNAWEITETAIIQELERVDNVLGKTDRAEIIYNCPQKCIIKLNFKIAGTKESAKTSGNRAIVLVDHSVRWCNILLVYSKNEICSPNETKKWVKIIQNNYPEIWKEFS